MSHKYGPSSEPIHISATGALLGLAGGWAEKVSEPAGGDPCSVLIPGHAHLLFVGFGVEVLDFMD